MTAAYLVGAKYDPAFSGEWLLDLDKGIATLAQSAPIDPERALVRRELLWVAGLLTMYFTTVYPSRVSPLPVTERLEVR